MRTVNGLASFGVVLAIFLVAAEEANAQGILQRLQGRVQARRFAPPFPVPAQPQRPGQAQPNTGNPGIGPNLADAPTPAGKFPAGTAPAAGQLPGALGPAGLANPNPNAVGVPNAGGLAIVGQSNPRLSNYRPMTGAPSGAILPAGPSATVPQTDASAMASAGDSILDRGNDEKSSDNPSNIGKPTLGIDVTERTERNGLEVVGFRSESKAALAGLRQGDLILSMNGNPVTVIGEAAEVLSSTSIGRNILLEIERSGTNLAVVVPVVARASDPVLPPQEFAQTSPQTSVMGSQDLGINGDTVKGVRGIKINAVEPGSPADLAGFMPGDRLVSIDGRLLINVDTLDREMNHFEPGKGVAAQVVRDGQLVQTRMQLNPKSLWNESSTIVKSPAPVEPKKSGSAMNGLGSMIGGLFSGKSTSKSSQTTPTAAAGSANATKQASSEVDLLDLNDEPIAKAGFEKLIEVEVDEMDFNDEFEAPTALESVMPPPAKKVDPIQSEIERLEQRLNELKAKAAEKG